MKSKLMIALAAALAAGSTHAAEWQWRADLGLEAVRNADGEDVGANASATRPALWLDGAAGTTFDNGFGMQFDLQGRYFDKTRKGDDDDWTRHSVTAAAHLFHGNESRRYGGFAGYGLQDDTGDSDEQMDFWMAGAEAQWFLPKGMLLAQVGYFDSEDEYEEGTQDAVFGRFGGRWYASESLAVGGSLSYALGEKYGNSDYDAEVIAFEGGLEYLFASKAWSFFANYQATRIENDLSGFDYGDTFHGVMVGFRFRTGGADLAGADRAATSLSLPDVARWVSFNANEIE